MTHQPLENNKPSKPIDTFRFNASSASFAKKEIDLQIEALETRIDNIVNKFTLDGNPIIVPIMHISHNKEELIGLSKGLSRVAELLEPLDVLRKRKEILDLAESDPSWLAWAFGDFDEEIDEALNKFLNLNES